MIRSVLMVCTGNICRSPLAAAELARQVPTLPTASAGVAALVGRPAEPNAIAVAERAGLDISAHQARQLDDASVAGHDLLLTMEQGQLDWIRDVFPQARGRVFLLGHWSGEEDVPDPFRQDLAAFEQAFAAIQRLCGDWRPRLVTS